MPEVSNHPGQPLHLKVQTIKQFLSPGSLNRKKKKKGYSASFNNEMNLKTF